VVNGEVCGKPHLRIARRETDTNAKRKQNRAKRDTSSIHARVVYAEHCARRGALSKANHAVTSNSVPNADPINIELLCAKHSEPAHPDRESARLSSILWPRPLTLEEFWSSDAGAEFLDKWFSIPKICQYFRTRSRVTMADIDDWNARDLIAPLFFNDNTDLHNPYDGRLTLTILFVSVLSSTTFDRLRVCVDIIPLRPKFEIPTSEVQTALLTMAEATLENSDLDSLTFVTSARIVKHQAKEQQPKAYYQAFFWVLIDLIVELLVLIIKPFDNQTES
jgi:hypothetical protein